MLRGCAISKGALRVISEEFSAFGGDLFYLLQKLNKPISCNNIEASGSSSVLRCAYVDASVDFSEQSESLT